MKSLLKTWFLLFAVLLSGSTALGQHPNLAGDPNLTVEGSHTVIIEWEVIDASIISNYVLQRSMRANGSSFQSLNNVCQKVGNRYTCKDEDLFKGQPDQTTQSEDVAYKLTVWHIDGFDDFDGTYFEAEVQYTTNAVRRTWGNIKSMFQ